MPLLTSTQRKWANECLLATSKWMTAKNMTNRKQRYRIARMVLMVTRTESNLHMYANRNIPASLKLPHDAVGTDHNSVGLYQQQVGQDGSNEFGWGDVTQCMDPMHSTHAFLHALYNKGLTGLNGPTLWMRIQDVQVSAISDGSNYKQYRWFSLLYLGIHWRQIEREARTS